MTSIKVHSEIYKQLKEDRGLYCGRHFYGAVEYVNLWEAEKGNINNPTDVAIAMDEAEFNYFLSGGIVGLVISSFVFRG